VLVSPTQKKFAHSKANVCAYGEMGSCAKLLAGIVVVDGVSHAAAREINKLYFHKVLTEMPRQIKIV
jgi:hypothetical protein